MNRVDPSRQAPALLPVKQAEAIVRDRERTAGLAARAAQKAEKNKRALRKVWDDLLTLIRLIAAWARRDYTHVPWSTIVAAVAALIYFVNPFDLIPDFLNVFGLIDDAAVLGLVVSAISEDLSRFRGWEREHPRSDFPPADSVDPVESVNPTKTE